MTLRERGRWAGAYHRQARADWSLFLELFARPDLPRCHALQHLQMATEKLGKAYRFRDTDTPSARLRSEHGGFSKFLMTFIKRPELEGLVTDLSVRSYLAALPALGREVERLTPSIDGENHPQNVEYPWCSGEVVIAPVDYSFPNLGFLHERRGLAFLKVIHLALERFDTGDGRA